MSSSFSILFPSFSFAPVSHLLSSFTSSSSTSRRPVYAEERQSHHKNKTNEIAFDVVIVGGGIVGTSLAHYLTKDNKNSQNHRKTGKNINVCVVEQESIASKCTGLSAATVFQTWSDRVLTGHLKKAIEDNTTSAVSLECPPKLAANVLISGTADILDQWQKSVENVGWIRSGGFLWSPSAENIDNATTKKTNEFVRTCYEADLGKDVLTAEESSKNEEKKGEKSLVWLENEKKSWEKMVGLGSLGSGGLSSSSSQRPVKFPDCGYWTPHAGYCDSSLFAHSLMNQSEENGARLMEGVGVVEVEWIETEGNEREVESGVSSGLSSSPKQDVVKTLKSDSVDDDMPYLMRMYTGRINKSGGNPFASSENSQTIKPNNSNNATPTDYWRITLSNNKQIYAKHLVFANGVKTQESLENLKLPKTYEPLKDSETGKLGQDILRTEIIPTRGFMSVVELTFPSIESAWKPGVFFSMDSFYHWAKNGQPGGDLVQSVNHDYRLKREAGHVYGKIEVIEDDDDEGHLPGGDGKEHQTGQMTTEETVEETHWGSVFLSKDQNTKAQNSTPHTPKTKSVPTKRRLYIGHDRVPEEFIENAKNSRRKIVADKFDNVDTLFTMDIIPFVEDSLFPGLFSQETIDKDKQIEVTHEGGWHCTMPFPGDGNPMIGKLNIGRLELGGRRGEELGSEESTTPTCWIASAFGPYGIKQSPMAMRLMAMQMRREMEGVEKKDVVQDAVDVDEIVNRGKHRGNYSPDTEDSELLFLADFILKVFDPNARRAPIVKF